MIHACYLILVLVVAFLSIFSGFRKGITRQLSSLLGFGFGATASRILSPEFSSYFLWVEPWSQAPEFNEISSNLLCGVIIYTCVYALFSLFSPLFHSAMAYIPIGMLNRILGSVFSLIKNLLWLSIFFNLFLCFHPGSRLLKYENANDGNLMAAVMSMTHGILGCNGAEEFAHFNQLKKAKSISCNFNTKNNVIISSC